MTSGAPLRFPLAPAGPRAEIPRKGRVHVCPSAETDAPSASSLSEHEPSMPGPHAATRRNRGLPAPPK